ADLHVPADPGDLVFVVDEPLRDAEATELRLQLRAETSRQQDVAPGVALVRRVPQVDATEAHSLRQPKGAEDCRQVSLRVRGRRVDVVVRQRLQAGANAALVDGPRVDELGQEHRVHGIAAQLVVGEPQVSVEGRSIEAMEVVAGDSDAVDEDPEGCPRRLLERLPQLRRDVPRLVLVAELDQTDVLRVAGEDLQSVRLRVDRDWRSLARHPREELTQLVRPLGDRDGELATQEREGVVPHAASFGWLKMSVLSSGSSAVRCSAAFAAGITTSVFSRRPSKPQRPPFLLLTKLRLANSTPRAQPLSTSFRLSPASSAHSA